MNIALALPNWIGDVVMATPAIRALRRRFPQANLIGVMRPYVSPVLAGTGWLDETILYERKAGDPQHRFLPVLRKLRARPLHAMVLFPNSLRFGLLGWLSGARRCVGYARGGRAALLTHRLQAPRQGGQWKPISAVDYYLELAYALGCPAEERRLELAILPEDERRADAVWSNLQLDSVRNVIVLNTGAATAPAKFWPQEHYVALAKRVAAAHADAVVLVICGPAERQQAQAIAQLANHPRVKSMADQDLSLGVAKAVIRRAAVMVSTDSGPRHIGHALDVPVVCLFGPIDPCWSDTFHSRAIHLQHRVPCGPCGQSVCPLGHHQCMRDLSVDIVYEAVERQLSLPRRQAA